MSHFIRIKQILFSTLLCFFFALSSQSYASVELRTGILTISSTDIDGMEREYISSDTTNGIFGEKWKTVYDNRIEYSSEIGVLFVYVAIKNNRHKFTLDEDGSWKGIAGEINEFDTGFTWSHDEHKYVFNSKGLLVEYRENDGLGYHVGYDEDGHINKISNSSENEYTINTDEEGRVIRITSLRTDEPEDISYYYQNNLLSRVLELGFEGEKVATDYQYNDNNYLTNINDIHGQNTQIEYQTFDDHIRVSEFIQADVKQKYTFEMLSDANNEKHYTISVDNTFYGNHNKIRHEHLDIYSNGKFLFTKEHKEYENEILVESTLYLNKCFPTYVFKNGKKTNINYDSDGKIVRKETDIGVVDYTYNDNGKIIFINRTLKDSPESVKWTRYSYNDRNLLVGSENSEEKHLGLEYDNDENIVVMRTKEKTLFISYSLDQKPTKITAVGLGAINVTYDPAGEISSVDAGDAGHELALYITESFQELLVLVNATTKDII